MKIGIAILLCLVATQTDCYKPVTGTGLPKHVKTVAVPAFQFEPQGARYRVSARLTDAVMRELIKRGRKLKIQGTRTGADAVIEGTVRDFNFTGVLLDREGRARVYEVNVVVAITVRDLREGKVIFDDQNLVFRDSFEFSSDPRSFFNEEDPAVQRMARAFAESIVSKLVNGLQVRKDKGS